MRFLRRHLQNEKRLQRLGLWKTHSQRNKNVNKSLDFLPWWCKVCTVQLHIVKRMVPLHLYGMVTLGRRVREEHSNEEEYQERVFLVVQEGEGGWSNMADNFAF